MFHRSKHANVRRTLNIYSLQERALHLLAESDDLLDGIPSYRVQLRVQRLLHDEIHRLEHFEVPPRNLLIAQRISRKPTQTSSQTVAMLAYQRSISLGFRIELASKVRFIVCSKDPNNPLQRVLLAQECEHLQHPLRRIDLAHYRRLAVRAIWAVLAPFGWSEDDLLQSSVTRLDQWM